METIEHELLTVTEAAERLRCTRWQVYHLMRTGALPYVLVGQRRRVTRTQLRAYVEDHTVGPEPGARSPEPGARSPEPGPRARARGDALAPTT